MFKFVCASLYICEERLVIDCQDVLCLPVVCALGGAGRGGGRQACQERATCGARARDAGKSVSLYKSGPSPGEGRLGARPCKDEVRKGRARETGRRGGRARARTSGEGERGHARQSRFSFSVLLPGDLPIIKSASQHGF